MRAAVARRLHKTHKTYKTYKTYKMMMGAPVFALTGYAAASHVIPRGVAMSLCGLARAKSCRGVKQCADLPQGYAGQLDGNGGMRVAHGVTLA